MSFGGLRSRTVWLLAAAAWGLFGAYCVWGFPPAVDLPAHGAQLETLKNLVLGDPAVSAVYEVKFPWGYGLDYWVFLPLALATNGAVAIRVALWVALMLFPLAAYAFLRALGRTPAAVVFALPLAFNVSYWYGLLSGLFAQPLALLTLAAFTRALNDSRRRWLLWANLAALATLLTHLVAFAALGVALGALALTARPLKRGLGRLAAALALPVAVSLPKVWSMAQRAVTPGPYAPTEYAFDSHFNWFFKNYGPEGRLAAAAPLLVCAVLVGAYLWRCRREPWGPAAMFFALGGLYFATPKTLSGIYLISVRLPALVGLVGLGVVGVEALPRWLRLALVGLCLASLGETAAFHWRFARAIDGLDAMVAKEPPERHGHVSLVGRTVLGSKHVYLDHLGQWWTARHGRVGHNFFADAEHHPVRFRPHVTLPTDLWAFPPEAALEFEALLVYGEVHLPAHLARWSLVEQAGPWRKLARPPTGDPGGAGGE